MGSDRFRFFNRLPANTPVRPQKIPPNPLFRNTLPLSPTRSIFCADFRLSPPVFSIFYEQGEGEGGATLPQFPALGMSSVPRYSPTTPSRCPPQTSWRRRRASGCWHGQRGVLLQGA